MTRPRVEVPNVLVRRKDVSTRATDVTVVDDRTLGKVGVFVIEHAELHRDEKEGGKKRHRVSLPDTIVRVHRLPERLADFCDTQKVLAEVEPESHQALWNAMGAEQFRREIKIERVEKIL